MSRSSKTCARVLPILACALALPSAAQDAAFDAQMLQWVADHGRASFRLGRGLMMREVQKAAALLMPNDHRFHLQRIAIKFLPARNLLELQAMGRATVPFVRDKQVQISADVRPEIAGDSVRLTYVDMHRSVSGCGADGPVCFMLKRAIDRHVGDGSAIQRLLDDSMNAALRPVFRELASSACAQGPVTPAHVKTGPEFLEITLAGAQREAQCVDRGDWLPATKARAAEHAGD